MIHKRWKIVWVAFMCACVQTIATFGMPVFVKHVTAELNWSRTDFMIGSASSGVFFGISASLAGFLLDWVGGRAVLAAGVILMSVTLAVMGSLQQLSQFYVLDSILGFGAGLLGYVPLTAVVSRWFDRRRGQALAIAMAGYSIGGLIMPLVCTVLIDSVGWRSTLRWSGPIAALVLLPGVLIVVRAPREGELADATAAARTTPGTAPRESRSGFSVRQAVRTRVFWLLFSSFFCVYFYSASVLNHLVAYLSDSGYSNTQAATAMGAMLGLGLVGKLLYGALGDRIGPFSSYVSLLATLVGAAIMLRLATVSLVFLTAFVLLYGLGLGGFLVISGLLVSRWFGLSAVGGIFGALTSGMIPAGVLGSLAPAMFFDLGWGYKRFFVILIVTNILALLASIRLLLDYKAVQKHGAGLMLGPMASQPAIDAQDVDIG